MIELTADWWHPEVMLHPLWLVINALVSFRLTRLWVSDMLPPLPAIRERVEAWADDRYQALRSQAIRADRENPEWQEATEQAGTRALQGGYNAPMVVGKCERAIEGWFRRYGGTHPVAYLVTCAWCSGFWIGGIAALLAATLPTAVWVWLAVPLAFSAVTGLLSHAADK